MNATIASRIAIRHRYVRSVDLARDVDDPEALDGYVVTSSVREAATRILAGLSAESRQRAFRVVGPYGAGKSAFGVFLAQLLRDRGCGHALQLLSEATGNSVELTPWRPIVVSGRRVSFTRELVRVVSGQCTEREGSAFADLRACAEQMLQQDGALDVLGVTSLLTTLAAETRARTGEGLLLLVDEMGRFLEYAATNMGSEDPSIFQALAEVSGGRPGANVAIVGFLHHRFVDYVAGMGGWIEAEWSRSSERYEELSFAGSTEQSLFMLARAIESTAGHSEPVRRRARRLYGEAVDRGVFSVPRQEVVQSAPDLYPLHPAAVAALAWAIHRFGQNERSLFSFLQSLEPAGFQRFAHSTEYDVANWYPIPSVFDHLASTMRESLVGDRVRRWSLAFDALAAADDLADDYRQVLKTVALIAILEPLPGLTANAGAVAWSLSADETHIQAILDKLAERNLIYRRPHRGDYSLWSSSSVDLTRWLDEARTRIRVPERIEDISALLTTCRPAVAHRHYHQTGTLRTFEVLLWTRGQTGKRSADGLILVAPVYPGEDRFMVLRDAAKAVGDDPVALVCARAVVPEDLKWAHELAVWSWVQDNCQELRVDELARTEVAGRIAAADRAITRTTTLLSSASSAREETWWYAGELVAVPQEGLSAFLSDVCDRAYNRAPVLTNELINRTKLSTSVASARTRLLDRMLTSSDLPGLGMDGAPPERTIYLSLFHASGMHREHSRGKYRFQEPPSDDPRQWGPAWELIAARLEGGDVTNFAELLEDLAKPPYGVRAHPALLVITAFVLASRDSIAIMERNTFQPDVTAAHFMRLVKSPRNFALKSLHESEKHYGLVEALARRLQVIGTCDCSVVGVSKKLYTWYNGLNLHTLKTASVSETALAVRAALRKATEPGDLLFRGLPSACGTVAVNGAVDVDHFVVSLNAALLELETATPSLRKRAAAVALRAFGVENPTALQSRIQNDYTPYCHYLTDYNLRVFVDRITSADVSSDRWIDGIAGHLTGKRPDNWSDDTLHKFNLEIRGMAQKLAMWFSLVSMQQTHSTDLRSIHVVRFDGQGTGIVVRPAEPDPFLASQFAAVREALADEPRAVEVLGQLLVEYADKQSVWDEHTEES